MSRMLGRVVQRHLRTRPPCPCATPRPQPAARAVDTAAAVAANSPRPLRSLASLGPPSKRALLRQSMSTRAPPATATSEEPAAKQARLDSAQVTETSEGSASAAPKDTPAGDVKAPEQAASMPTSLQPQPADRFLVSIDKAAFPHARPPTRGSAFAAGYDVYAAEDVTLPARNGRKVVPTGIRLAIPSGCYGRVAPRSGLATKHGIDVGAGVIDADYRGMLGVLLFNLGDADFEIKAGDRIAQLVLERISTPEVEVVESLDETVRGAGGFGSTGGFGPQQVLETAGKVGA